MPPEVAARFQELIKKDSLTDKMRLWVRDYMQQTPDGKYVPKEIPDVTNTEDLPDDVARELFLVCQNALVGMNGALAAFKDSDPQSRDFVNAYFGPEQGKLFNISPASQECEDGIRAIVDLIRNNPTIKRYLLAQESDGKKLFDNEGKLDEFLGKCDKKEYNTKGGVQSKIKKVAEALDRATWGVLPDDLQPINQIKEEINAVIDDKAFAMDPASITPQKLQAFKDNIKEKDGILQTLYKNKTIRSRFGKYDNGTISTLIEEKAENEIDYQKTDSENYLAPKYDDVLNPIQQLEKWSTDTYNNTLKKYEELRGGHLFFGNEAKDICKAIDKEKVKPADGLNSLLEKESAVSKRLASNPVASQHFKWFCETMNGVKDDIPKAIDGCWKNARQMKCVIEKIILKATDPKNDDIHAMEKAKTAMEIMTVMKYGMLTSKVMDAMKQTDFNVFSDGKLSWNSNEGIQFVTKAFDQSVKAAFLGVGYSITFVRNKIMMSGMRFTNKSNAGGLLGKKKKEEQDRLASQRNIGPANLRNEITSKEAERNRHLTTLQNFATQGVNQRTIDRDTQRKAQIDAQLEPIKQSRDNAQKEMERQQKIKDRYEDKKNEYEEQNKILTGQADREQEQQINQDINDTQNEINRLRNRLSAPVLVDDQNIPITDPNEQQATRQRLADILSRLNEHLAQKQQEIINLQNTLPARQQAAQQKINDEHLTDAFNAYNAADTAYNTANNDFQNADNNYNTIINNTHYQDLSDRIKEFNDATKGVEELTKTIEEKQNALDNWDDNHKNKLIELENYWNFLQSGKTTTWRLSLENAQNKFNKNKPRIFQNYVDAHGLAA